jgi:hypothetical protein
VKPLTNGEQVEMNIEWSRNKKREKKKNYNSFAISTVKIHIWRKEKKEQLNKKLTKNPWNNIRGGRMSLINRSFCRLIIK